MGTDAEVPAHETAATRVIELRGRTVVPGLSDKHFHSAGGGAGVDLSGARTLAAVLSAIAAPVREAVPGAVVVTNSDWHEAQFAEQRLPRRDLDAAAPDQPVVVLGGHEYVLNSAGLARWAITADTVTAAALANGSDTVWNLTVTPSGTGTVELSLGLTENCTDTGAICTSDGRKLSSAVLPDGSTR